MNDVNISVFMGAVYNEPEVKNFASGSSKLTFSVKSIKKFLNRDGDEKEAFVFYNIEKWGSEDNELPDVEKDMNVLVVGELNTESWEDKDSGAKRYKKFIKARVISMVL